MIKIQLLLPAAVKNAKLNNDDVRHEVERISKELGRDFTQFLREENGILYFVAPKGALHPDNWWQIPAYGTDGDVPDSPAGLALFFLTTTSLPFARHHIEWAEFVWDCFADDVGAIIEASRGFGKSIFMRILMAYHLGLYPSLSSLIIRSANPPAQKTAEGIAKIILENDAWALWFPDVQPKSKPGQAGGEWSAQSGYSIIDLSVPSDEWATMESARTSPSLTKFGIGGKGILGSRTTLVMLADDLHDEENSASVTQLEQLITRFEEIVEPTREPGSRLAIIGTPWGPDDLLQTLPNTSEYRKMKTPITIEGTYPGTPAWPELYDEEEIRKIYEKDTTPGKRGFRRNRLLDLEADIDRHFTYTFYPHKKIQDHWFVRMGIDFAILEPGATGHGRSYFAITITTQEPVSGSWIVCDGFVGQVTRSQAERIIIDLYDKYGRKPRVEIICVERDGSGAIFEDYLMRLPLGMPVLGENTGGVAKEVRWEYSLEPSLANERILISDREHHPFLTQVLRALNIYPNIGKRGDMAADILDSMVWAHYHAFMEYGDPVRRRKAQKKDNPNPYMQLAQGP